MKHEHHTLIASQRGKQLIKEAWRNWYRQTQSQVRMVSASEMNEIFLRETSKILQLDRDEDGVLEDSCIAEIRHLECFKAAKERIKASIFIAFCQVLELNWEDVIEEANTKKLKFMKRERPTLRASQSGKELIKKAWKDWYRKTQSKERMANALEMNEIFLRETSKKLQPDIDWDDVSEDDYIAGIHHLRRFKAAKERITASIFIAFCEVLGLNWEDIKEEVDTNRDLKEAPEIEDFYGRTQELVELQERLIKIPSRLVLIYGMRGVGKTAFARNLVDRFANKYNRLIWIYLESTQPFQVTLNRLVHFLSKGEKEEGDIAQIMQYLHQQKCLIVLDGWEEIITNNKGDSTNDFINRIARESHKSCLLLLSRRNPNNIQDLEGKFVYSKKLLRLTKQEVQELIIAKGLFGTDANVEKFSSNYGNPWILKRVIKRIINVFNGNISPFLDHGNTTFVDEETTDFLNEEFQKLSQAEINVIYWVALRRNTALWEQLLQDSRQFLTDRQLFEILDSLISRHCFMEKNIEEMPIIYILDPVILRYSNERFVAENYVQIDQLIQSSIINGTELFITHAFLTNYPKDEELNQEQMRRIVQPIAKMLLANFRSQDKLENQLRRILALIEDKGLSQGYAYQNISHLISVCQQI